MNVLNFKRCSVGIYGNYLNSGRVAIAKSIIKTVVQLISGFRRNPLYSIRAFHLIDKLCKQTFIKTLDFSHKAKVGFSIT